MTDGAGGSENGSIQLKYLSVSSDNSTYLGVTPRSTSEAFWDCSDLLSLDRSWNPDLNRASLNSQQSLLSSTSTLCPDGNNRVIPEGLLPLLASREQSVASFVDDSPPKQPSPQSTEKTFLLKPPSAHNKTQKKKQQLETSAAATEGASVAAAARPKNLSVETPSNRPGDLSIIHMQIHVCLHLCIHIYKVVVYRLHTHTWTFHEQRHS